MILTSYFTECRKNKALQWNPSDSEENYKKYQVLPDGSKIENYSCTEIDYTFNSNGFRCDEFTEESELSILFMGCSHTEGVGLPLISVWSNLLLSDIKNKKEHIDKKIPYWSIAVPGTGVDTMARELSNYAHIVKPKLIFGLVNDFSRRELIADGVVQLWGPHYTNKHSVDYNKVAVNEDFAWYETYRSLLIINSIAREYNATVILGTLNDIDSSKTQMEFSNIIIKKIEIEFNEDDYKRLPKPKARDNIHAGEHWQYGIFRLFTKYIKEHNLLV